MKHKKSRRPKLVPLAKAIKHLKALKAEIESDLERLLSEVESGLSDLGRCDVPALKRRDLKVELVELDHPSMQSRLRGAAIQAEEIGRAIEGADPGADDDFREIADALESIQMGFGY